VKHSPYITWAKQHHEIRYNLSSSGVPAPSLETLGVTMADWSLTEEHEDGWAPLVERVASRYGVATSSIALAQGTSMANHLVFTLLIEPDDHVLLEHPCYEPLHLVPQLLHARVDFFERAREKDFAIDVRAVEAKLTPKTRLVVVSNLHNPTGRFDTTEELRALGALAEERDFHVLVDEVYLEWLVGDGVPSAASLSPRFITTRSLTKAYGLDAVRAGWILAEDRIASKLRRLMDLYSVKMAHASERLAARALDRADAILEPLSVRLDQNRALVASFVDAHASLCWMTPSAGSVGLVYWDGSGNERMERLVEALIERDTLVAPGRFFGVPEAFRIGYGMDTESLSAGLSRLDEALALVGSGA